MARREGGRFMVRERERESCTYSCVQACECFVPKPEIGLISGPPVKLQETSSLHRGTREEYSSIALAFQAKHVGNATC